MKSPREISLVDRMPLIGSPLRNAERETIVGAIVKVAQEKNEWGRIRSQQLVEPLEGMTIHKLFPQKCWNAFHQMVEEGLLIRGKDDEGEYVEATEKLIDLLTPDPVR